MNNLVLKHLHDICLYSLGCSCSWRRTNVRKHFHLESHLIDNFACVAQIPSEIWTRVLWEFADSLAQRFCDKMAHLWRSCCVKSWECVWLKFLFFTHHSHRTSNCCQAVSTNVWHLEVRTVPLLIRLSFVELRRTLYSLTLVILSSQTCHVPSQLYFPLVSLAITNNAYHCTFVVFVVLLKCLACMVSAVGGPYEDSSGVLRFSFS